jgi:nicotinamidase-related amidase
LAKTALFCRTDESGKAGRHDAAIASKSAAVIEMRITSPAPGFAEFSEPGDILITKTTWGAFFRTDLDAELRSRGVRTIVLGGVATHVGVDTTARQAWELGYELVIARDVTTSMAVEPHEATMRHIFPRIARVTDAVDLAFRA